MQVCGYLTDVEGNYDYFERYVAISRVIKWADDEKSELELNDGCEFVFGGDSQDKGIGEIRSAPPPHAPLQSATLNPNTTTNSFPRSGLSSTS